MADVRVHLQDQALLLALAAPGTARHESSPGGVLKDLADTLVGLGGALEVLVGLDLLTDLLALLGRDRLLARLPQLLNSLLVVSEILLAANENDGQALAEVQNLRNPLLLDVVEGIGGVHSEANQDNVGVRVREGSKTVIVLLASGIPKGQLNVLAINLDIGDVVLEDGGDVDLGESALGENNQQTGLATGTIANDDELATDLSHGDEADVREACWERLFRKGVERVSKPCKG
jgi:hypothetical protein